MTQDLSKMLSMVLADPHRLLEGAVQPIGYVGFDVPHDVMLASGRPFFHLPWVKGRKTPLADRWLESSFPGWARSMLEDWLSGAFDGVAQVVFSRGDDAAQRLYYYICELRRRGLAAGPEPLIFDIAKISRPSSLKHCEAAVRQLMSALAIDEAQLGSGIAAANEQRAHYARLEAARSGAGHLYENIARASLFSVCWPLLQRLPMPPVVSAHRVILAGSVPADDALHRAIESVGWNVVGEFHQLTLTRLGAPLATAELGALAALARHCHAGVGGSRDFSDRAAALVQLATQRRAQAVVLWLTDEDEVLAWHVARQRAALAAAGLPALVLTRRRWDGSDAVDTAICKFLQELAR